MSDDSCDDVLDFSLTPHTKHPRDSFRVAPHGLTLYLEDVAQSFDIRDLSASGCSLHAPAGLLTVGRIISGDLHIGDARYINALTLKVVRHITDTSVACVFQTLSRRQGIMLDRLLLEIQKRSIAPLVARGKRNQQ